jgi:hypothetical protein
VSSGGSHFDRAFDMLLTMDLGKIIVDFAGHEIRLTGNWLQLAKRQSESASF